MDLRWKCVKSFVIWIKEKIVRFEGIWMKNLWEFVNDMIDVNDIIIIFN